MNGVRSAGIALLVTLMALGAAASRRGAERGPVAGVAAGPEHWRVIDTALKGDLPGRTPTSTVVARPQGCGLLSPLKVKLRALSTPVVGGELALEATVINGLDDGTVRTWIRIPAGALEVIGEASWIDTLAKGDVMTHRVMVRVLTGDPIPLTAKAASTDPSQAGFPAGEGYTTLYPVEVVPAGFRVHWSATTLRPLSEPPPAVVSLKNGDRAVVIHGDR